MKTKGVLFAAVETAVGLLALLIFTTPSYQALGACSLEPERSTNFVGQVHGVTATVTTNGSPAVGVLVSFEVISGPNSGPGGSGETGADGQVVFNYVGNGGVGTDIIRATGAVNNVAFTCLATQVWRTAVNSPSIQCPASIVTNSAPDGCSRSVAFAPIAMGSPMPSVRCRIGSDAITSPHLFPAGVSTVTCVASNANGATACSFTVTVTESEPPAITCPGDRMVPVLPGETSAVVDFEPPTATDNCSAVLTVCEPPSGSTFVLGATPVTCIASDSSGNTNACFFTVSVEEGQQETHDLAVTRIRVPRFVNLNARVPILTKRVIVTIQNRSPHTETISDFDQLTRLVSLTVESLDPEVCAEIVPELLGRPPQRRLPLNLRPKQTLNVYFEVTFDCAVNPSKGLGQEDFRYSARVNHEAIDELFDTHPECDVCPREPLEGGVDPNPNGRIRDRGCGAPRGDGTFGNEVLTDVSIR